MIIFPFPPPILFPNHKSHWAVKARAVKSYRANIAWITRASVDWIDGKGDIPILLVFCPPDRRRRDRDGLLSSFKAGLDGIADALQVDDYRFRPTIDVGDVIKDGEVRVFINGT